MDEHDKKELDKVADDTLKVASVGGTALFGIASFIGGSAVAVAGLPIAAGVVASALAWKGFRHLSKDDNK
jgi:hypothetical protein